MPQRRSNAEVARLLAIRITQQVQRGAGKGLAAAVPFIASRVREAVSVPAPRRAVRGLPQGGARKGPILYYRATTRAIQGAPPRKLSGKLRQSVWGKMITPTKAVIGANARGYSRTGRGANYPAILELSRDQRRRHAFILPTIQKYRREIGQIMGRQLKVAIGGAR